MGAPRRKGRPPDQGHLDRLIEACEHLEARAEELITEARRLRSMVDGARPIFGPNPAPPRVAGWNREEPRRLAAREET